MIDIVVGYLVVQMLTLLFNVLPHLLFHVQKLFDNFVLLNKLFNVHSHLMYLFGDSPVDPDNVLPVGFPLDLLGNRPEPLIGGALQLLDLAADLIEAAVVDARLQAGHLRDDLAHVVRGLDRGLLERLLDPLHVHLVLLQLVHLGFEVADHIGRGQVVPVGHSAGEPVKRIEELFDVLGLLCVHLDHIQQIQFQLLQIGMSYKVIHALSMVFYIILELLKVETSHILIQIA